MSTILLALSTWLHTLATVVMIGHYVFLSLLIVIKHVIVLAFLALAIFSERVFIGQIGDEKPEALKKFHLSLGANLILGMLILLLTTVAQSI